jgi:hypothetical protein
MSFRSIEIVAAFGAQCFWLHLGRCCIGSIVPRLIAHGVIVVGVLGGPYIVQAALSGINPCPRSSRRRMGRLRPLCDRVGFGGVSERYDEYGCIEGVARDRNIEMVCDFFSAARRAGRFLAEAQTHTGNPEWFDPDIEIVALLYLVEQATTCAEIFQESHGG